MVRHWGSGEAASKKHPRRAFSFMSLGTRTKGWDKNPPPRDCPYGIFGKRMQRSLMGFGSLATAFYLRDLISKAALNESHGTLNPGKGNMRHFHERLGHHKNDTTIEYKTMYTQPLISKIRKVMKGAHAARNADVNVIQRDISILSHNDAKKCGWSMPATIEKTSHDIKSEFTAQFLLPFSECDKYLKDPAIYCEQVERNKIKLSLSGTWPAILYNEAMVEADNELIGLFRSETLLWCGITILCSPSAGCGWKYPERGARSFSASQKELNAEINGIDKVTPEVITYISTLVVFAIHDSKCFSRKLGGINLSELYHDVVTVLRTKTEWASKTLGFWNEIFFGEREEEEEEPKVNREERFKRLEAKQREREGLGEVDAGLPRSLTPPATTPPCGQGIPRPTQAPDHSSPGSPPPDNTDNEDQATADQPQGGSRSCWPISQPEVPSPLQSKNSQKRKITIPDSDSNPDSSDLEGYETDPTTRLPPKKKQRRYSTEQESPPATPQPMIRAKRKQAVEPSPSQLQHHAMHGTWRDICGDLERSIGHAAVAGYKEAGAEFTRIVSMGAEEGTCYFNENYERIEWLKNDVKKKYKNISAAGPIPQENQGSGATSKPPAQKKKCVLPSVSKISVIYLRHWTIYIRSDVESTSPQEQSTPENS
ncbi:hypothetical protein BDM02DRAFT_3192109 [Thelephora ganbajun]|uniref:Uncharacterized protein n=1 Tax=Thelephora ganbajun TaxID=370292 RepID=A0ACB6Z177_THEGA|nr:hypothetical protein BDM02DRAFT_3192109 [Thelephora ganbajun]